MITRCRRVLLGAVVLVIVAGWAISNRAEVAEAWQAVTCRAPCAPLAPEQLRLQVVKAYLHHLLDRNVERHDTGGNYQLALLPRPMTEEDVARSIKDATLLDTLTNGATVLGDHAQIDALNVEALAHDPSIAVYSLHHRIAQVVPTRSIRQASAAEVENHFRAPRTHPTFSWWEGVRGYGQRFFWITPYGRLQLACCDGRGEQDGHDAHWWQQYSLSTRKFSTPWLMATSDRGAILIRKHDGDEDRLVF